MRTGDLALTHCAARGSVPKRGLRRSGSSQLLFLVRREGRGDGRTDHLFREMYFEQTSLLPLTANNCLIDPLPLSLPPDASVPVEPADFWSMYIPGVHGLVLYYRGKSATFLPKVHIILSHSLSLLDALLGSLRFFFMITRYK